MKRQLCEAKYEPSSRSRVVLYKAWHGVEGHYRHLPKIMDGFIFCSSKCERAFHKKVKGLVKK